jgi:YfiH family protein
MSDLVLKKEEGISLLFSPVLKKIPWLIHGIGFPIKTKGKDDPALKSLIRHLGIEHHPLITLRQIHSSRVITIKKKTPHHHRGLVGDGIITDLPRVAIAVFTADCIPLILVAERRRAIGVVHAGWRGTKANIAGNAVRFMISELQASPDELSAYMGPAICPRCYQVGKEVVEPFLLQFPEEERVVLNRGGKYFLDLIKANKKQLINEGITEERIYKSGICSFCHPVNLPSYRREKENAGRMLTLAMIKG